MIVWGANTLLCTAWSALWGNRSPGSSSSGFDVAKMLASVESPGAVRVGVLEEAVSLRADTEPGRQEMPGARQLVRQDGWQAAIFGGRNCPSLLMVAHQPVSASEVTS